MKAALKTRIEKVLPRLASDHVGEVVATVSAIRRILASEGMDLHDLASALGKRTKEPVDLNARKVRRLERTIEIQRIAIREHVDTIAALKAEVAALREVSKKLDTPVSTSLDTRAIAKRRAVADLLTEEPKLSDRAIARRLSVSPTTVGTIRKSLAGIDVGGRSTRTR